MDIRQVPQLRSDFIEVEARALRERDQDDLVKGRFAVAALAPETSRPGTTSNTWMVKQATQAGQPLKASAVANGDVRESANALSGDRRWPT